MNYITIDLNNITFGTTYTVVNGIGAKMRRNTPVRLENFNVSNRHINNVELYFSNNQTATFTGLIYFDANDTKNVTINTSNNRVTIS